MKKLLITSLLLTSLIIVGCDKEEEIDKVSNKIANEMTENNSSYDDAANKVLDGMNITTDDVPQEIAEEVEDKTAEIVEQQTQEVQEVQEAPAYEEPVQEVTNPEVPIQGEDLTPQERIFNAELIVKIKDSGKGIKPENLSYVQDLTLEDGQVVKVYVDMYELGVNSMIYLYATSEDGKVGVVYNFGPVYEAAHYNYLSSETVVTIHWLNSDEDPVNASDKMELLKVVMTVKDKELDARQAFGRTLN